MILNKAKTRTLDLERQEIKDTIVFRNHPCMSHCLLYKKTNLDSLSFALNCRPNPEK